MDLMAFIPDFTTSANIQRIPTIVHNCEVPPEVDELEQFVKGTSLMSRMHCWFLQKRVLSRKHPLTRWCLKSSTAARYEIHRHLKSHPYMIHPFSSFRIFWESVITLFTFVALLITPILITFYLDKHGIWCALNNIIDVVFICDIIIWFFTGYYDYHTKTVVLDPRIVATKYVKTFFFVDILPVLPIEFIEHLFFEHVWYCAALNMLKILRMRTLIIYSRRLRDVYRISFQSLKMLEMAMVVIMCVHWSACLEYYIPMTVAKIVGKNENSWIYSEYMEKMETVFKKYLTCINRASTALVSSAHYLDMKTPEDIILNLILSILGFIGFVYLLAQFSQLITTFHSRSKRYVKLVQQLQEYMWHKELPQSLQRQLLGYYNAWIRKGFERDKKIISQVSPYLREELILHNYLRFIGTVKLLKHLPETVVARLAASLRPEIFMPGDVIVKASTCGDALYFVASGTVSVYTSSGKEVCHLEDGAYFGEIALVMENEHRTMTIIAVETCEIYVLSRTDFQRVITPYPDLLNRLQNMALQHLERSPLLTNAYDSETTMTSTNLNISSIKGKRKD